DRARGGVRAGDVVIVLVAVAPYYPAALVLAGDEFQAHADFAIAKIHSVQDGERRAVASGIARNLRQNVGLAARGLVPADLPFGRPAVIGHGYGPAGRGSPDNLAIKREYLRCRRK